MKSAAIFYQDAAVAASQVPSVRDRTSSKAGIPVVEKYAVALTATNFRSQATDMKEKKIDLVITIAEINAIANLAQAFEDVDYFPKVPFYGAQAYGQKLIQLAGPGRRGHGDRPHLRRPRGEGQRAGDGRLRHLVQAHRRRRRRRLLRRARRGWPPSMFVEALQGGGARPDPGEDRRPA